MGYYSDVCLVLSAKGFEELNCRIESMDKDTRFSVVALLDYCNAYEEHEGLSLYLWTDIKWYPSYREIGALMGALTDMDDSWYRFVEVGEDGREDDFGDLRSVFMPYVRHSVTYTSMKSEPPKQYASAGWTIEDLVFVYGINEDKARDILLDIGEELHRAMRSAGWEVVDAAVRGIK